METDDDALFRALADSTRRLILDELAQSAGGQSLFEICVRLIQTHGLAITRQGVSKHLGILEEAGLVRIEWQGRTKLHFLDRKPLREMHGRWFSKHIQGDGA